MEPLPRTRRLDCKRRVRPRRCGAWLTAFSIASAAARPGFAGGGAATDAYEGVRRDAPLDVHGLLDLYFQHDFDRPPSGTVQLRAFDVRSDAPALDFARLTLAHRPDRFGFRLDAGVGDTADGYLRSDPSAATHPRLSRVLSYVEQAFVTARLPVERAVVAIDAGKFGTPVGLEDNEAQQSWSYSRSLLYTWAEPTTHTGLRATVAANDAFAVSAFWLNGWNANLVDGNGMRSFAAAASWRPRETLSLSATYMAGLERAPQRLADPTLSLRHEIDGFATYAPIRDVSFAFTADYGLDASGGGVSWWGVGGYLHGRLRPWLAATLRGEHYTDPDGFTTGARQRLAELTGTIEVSGKVSGATLIGRLEYRRDQSDVPVFEAASPPRATHQDTVTVALMALF